METITLTIKIQKDIYAILEEKVKVRGESIEEYVLYLIEQDISEQQALAELKKEN